MTSELLRQVRVLDPVSATDRVADVLMVEGIIQAIADPVVDWPADAQIRDCQGWVLGPGLVDLYSHSGEPGFEARETLMSLAQAAIAGGWTRVTLLPDTQPALDHPSQVEGLQAHCRQLGMGNLPLQVQVWGALTLETQGTQMAEFADLATAGVVGFTDGKALNHSGIVRRSLEYLQPLAKPVALWPCDLNLTGNGVMREGLTSLQLGLPGNPVIAETAALAALLELIAATGTPVHLMRISTARSVELIQEAKARGLPITASTTWMHVLLNSDHLQTYDPCLRLDPPLGNPGDQTALREGLQQGILDAIAVDHAPYTYEEKTVAFAEAPPGAMGLELALPLLWQGLVTPGLWSALELWSCLSTRPALCLQQSPALLVPGQPAELTLFNPDLTWVVDSQTLKSRASNTPWLGQTLVGQVVQTWRSIGS
ncbi:dihydroorotase [Neosynechococcus sphagnicola sy1]|uniref:Dihydroorotase n=1 Tax=Neosynechococcus sphagnicola sy1 TaxID=1497020 RepID=A0A098TLJ4_9CYAN|nr:dihydroorotase [Neosynechococcus sphagnicola]KGF71718.1 dihydroorotase [Neosynechococcus sphagnicola sy1]